VSSSPDRSAPGSSKDSAVSVSSTSTTGDWVTLRLAAAVTMRPPHGCSRCDRQEVRLGVDRET
jgi:hypothetical protein